MIKKGFLNKESFRYELEDTTESLYYDNKGLSGYEVLNE